MAATAGTVALPSLNALRAPASSSGPELAGDALGDDGVGRGVSELCLRQALGAPVRYLLVLRQLEAEQVGGDLGEAQAAALGAVRQARHLQGAPGAAQPDALRQQHGVLEGRVVDDQLAVLERLQHADRHVLEVDDVDGRRGRIVDLRQAGRRPERVEAGPALRRRLVHGAPAVLRDANPGQVVACVIGAVSMSKPSAGAEQRREGLARPVERR